MIKSIELYLVTNNQGLEAVDYYSQVFQAEIKSCTTFGQAMPNTPEENKNLVLNASLDIQGIRLQISDHGPGQDYVQGTNMTACIMVDTAQEARKLYDKLAEEAQQINLELQETPWSPAYGIVVDKFGMTWQINTEIDGFVSETVRF
ncbi:VOC family protein [Vaginisenegalia massiliensis]|uniref:VOC family protein n=1 Tax=Vaginisenegalia massiliensis TaxID=2058294 RepID=UPI000F5422F8|nr:VOC family protein [Vaginisenegalia massiliensis]